jgi:hypothetical protein
MVARVTEVRVRPEDVEEATRLFDESVVPAARQEEGFIGGLLLAREDGHAFVIDICDTIENMRANERNGFYQAQVKKFADKIVGHPHREFFDVKVAKRLRGGPELLQEVD